MDLFIVVIDTLVIMAYILLFALISPTMMRFIKKMKLRVFFQLFPVLSLILASSIAICIGYGGFQETLFFPINKYHFFSTFAIPTIPDIDDETPMEREV